MAVGHEAGEDQFAPRATREWLRDRKQIAEALLVPGEDRDGAQRSGMRLRRELEVVPKDRRLELPQGRRRLDPELGDEGLPHGPVHLERLRLAAGSVERLHQRGGEALVERVFADECLELGDELGVLAQREIGLDPQLERGQTRSLEALDLRLRGRVVGQIR